MAHVDDHKHSDAVCSSAAPGTNQQLIIRPKMQVAAAASRVAVLMMIRIVRRLLQALMIAACLLWAAWWFVSPELDPGSLIRGRISRYLQPLLMSQTRARGAGQIRPGGLILLFQTLPFVAVPMLSFAVIALDRAAAAIVHVAIKRKELSAAGSGQYNLNLHNDHIVGTNIHNGNRPTDNTNYSSAVISRWRQWHCNRLIVAARLALAYPVYIGKPLAGALMLAELLAIVSILVLAMYNFGRLTHLASRRIDHAAAAASAYSKPSWEKLHYAARYAGTVAALPFSLLWIPVSRGSPLLRVAGVPFERAVRYHMWLATFMMLLLAFHVVGYVLYYLEIDQADRIYGWRGGGSSYAVLPGLLAAIVGLLLWLASAEYVRRRAYDLFFAAHHLYIPFFLFWLYHVVWTYPLFIIPALLFFVDRFLRMLQSRRLVHVLCAKLHESGAVELVLPVDPGLSYCPLSKWCIAIPGLSRLVQWHFFSTFSASISTNTVSVIIKPRGGWTNALRHQFDGPVSRSDDRHESQPTTLHDDQATVAASCLFSFRARIEGPYPDESDFYLRYRRLILVGGGIGISPLLAIVQDLLHRYQRAARAGQHDVMPSRTVVVYHCVRKPSDLCVLNSVDPRRIFPGIYGAANSGRGLSIWVHAYITSADMDDYSGIEELVEANTDDNTIMDLHEFRVLYDARSTCRRSWPRVFYPRPAAAAGSGSAGISGISTTGAIGWVASTTIASIAGFFVLFGLANTYIIGSRANGNISNYNRAHLLVACMILGTAVFGGFIVLLWYLRIVLLDSARKKKLDGIDADHAAAADASMIINNSPREAITLSYKSSDHRLGKAASCNYMDMHDIKSGGSVDEEAACGRLSAEELSSFAGDVQFRRRPNWKEVFDGLDNAYQNECIGVLVFGSQSMQEDVARKCRRSCSHCLRPPVLASKNGNVFRYHAGSAQF